jgi:hypothetical protein
MDVPADGGDVTPSEQALRGAQTSASPTTSSGGSGAHHRTTIVPVIAFPWTAQL